MLGKSCIKLIQLSLGSKPGIYLKRVDLGSIVFEYDPEQIFLSEIEAELDELGFPILQDNDVAFAEKIKIAAVELIHYGNNANSLIRNSDYIADRLQEPYERISKVFSRVTGTTLEKYIIQLKIEKAKELITNEQHTLSEIAFMLGYSSVHYLSNQFKKTTGVTVSEFKENPAAYRKTIEELL